MTSLKRVTTYISQHPVTGQVSGDLIDVVKNTWELIDIIYISKCDLLIFDRKKRLMLNKCFKKIMDKYSSEDNNSNKKKSTKASSSNQMPALAPIPASPLKTVVLSPHISQVVIPSTDINVNSIS